MKMYKKYIEISEEIEENIIGYNKYIIGYVDFLGIHEALKNDNGANLNFFKEIYDRLINYINSDNLFNINNLKVKIFSDNIVIASKIEEVSIDSSLEQVINMIRIIQIQTLAFYGWMLRGGISQGDLYIDDVFTIGSGLINAYEIESCISNYPRVVIDKKLVKKMNFKDFSTVYGLDFIFQDFDGEFYVNYLSMLSQDNIYNFCHVHKSYTEEKNKKEKNNKVKQKYCWQIKYFDRVLAWCDNREFIIKERSLN